MLSCGVSSTGREGSVSGVSSMAFSSLGGDDFLIGMGIPFCGYGKILAWYWIFRKH